MRMKRCVAVFLLVVLLASQIAIAETFSNDPGAINQAAQSVMLLEVYCDDTLISTASGFVAFNSKMLITNYHVIEGATEILAFSDDGVQYTIDRVYAADEAADLAILGFAAATNLTPLSLNMDGELLRAASILTISSPMGILNTVSMGNISALFDAEGISYIQISAPISPGSSGGALFDEQGNVIGVLEGALADAQNMNLAIGIRHAQDLYGTIDEARFASLKGYYPQAESGGLPPAPTLRPDDDMEAVSRMYPPLQKGDRGSTVQDLQIALVALGYLDDKADGVFGEKTEKAVLEFQEANSLAADGVASPQTQKIICDVFDAKYPEPEIPLIIPMSAYGEWRLENGNAVSFHLQVQNISGRRTISAYELYAYPADEQGNSLLEGDSVYKQTTKGAIAPGEMAYSDFLYLSSASKIRQICVAIHEIQFASGSVITIPEEDMVFCQWVLES